MVNNTQTPAEEPESHNPAFSLLSILRTVWKRKVRISMAWVLFAMVGVAVVRFLPAVYLSGNSGFRVAIRACGGLAWKVAPAGKAGG
jgi:hypothetical protein